MTRSSKRQSVKRNVPVYTETPCSHRLTGAVLTNYPNINIRYLSGPDVEALQLTDDEILDAVEVSLAAQGTGDTVIEPRMHLIPDETFRGHFNVLRGYIAPLGIAGVKIVGDYIDNYKKGLPSEHATLNLMDARTGVPVAIVDALERAAAGSFV